MAPDTTVAKQRAALKAWLGRSHPDDEITWAETHISILAFGRERAWKLKKAVAFPFVDLSTRELRLAQCEREVVLNRRLAPDVYLGVVPLDDAGLVVDHLVEMVRMPDDRRLAALAAGGSAMPCLDRVVELVARFHDAAARGGAIDASATRDAVAELWDTNLAELGPHVGAIFEQRDVDRVAVLAARYLAGRAPLFDARIAAGRARDGHGDLLADDIFCLADGPRVLDCLEFDDHLRYGDVLADIAFLAMDLERLGCADLARHVLDRYAEVAGDAWPVSLEHLYIAYRAVVRAKVACLRAGEGTEGSATTARRLLAMSRDHLESGRVRVALIGGPPGTGKTTLANDVSRRLLWPVLHSDEIRKELAGLPTTAHDAAALDAGIYTNEWDVRTYDALCSRARDLLEQGTSVVLDASWNGPDWRARAARVAESTSSELLAFRCSIDPAVASDRVAARASAGTDASDATGELARTLSGRFFDWPESTTVDTSARPDVVATSVVAALRGQGTAAP